MLEGEFSLAVEVLEGIFSLAVEVLGGGCRGVGGGEGCRSVGGGVSLAVEVLGGRGYSAWLLMCWGAGQGVFQLG